MFPRTGHSDRQRAGRRDSGFRHEPCGIGRWSSWRSWSCSRPAARLRRGLPTTAARCRPLPCRRLPEAVPGVSSPVVPASHVEEELPIPEPAAIADDASVISLEQLEEIGLNNNPSLAQHAARIESLRGKWIQAGLAKNPAIGYSGEEIGDLGTAGLQGGFISQEYVLACKRELSRAVVAQEIAKAEQAWAAQRQRILTDVRVAYYDVLIAQRKVEVADELVRISDSAVAASEALLRAAEISVIAVLQAEVEAEQAKVTLRQAGNEKALAWRRLVTIVGLPEMVPRHLLGPLEDSLPDLTWEESLHRVLNESPEISEAVAEIERGEGRFTARVSSPCPTPMSSCSFTPRRTATRSRGSWSACRFPFSIATKAGCSRPKPQSSRPSAICSVWSWTCGSVSCAPIAGIGTPASRSMPTRQASWAKPNRTWTSLSAATSRASSTT